MGEMVNSPKHYNNYPIETIDMMIKIFGVEQTKNFCLMNAFKYRMRIGFKDSIEQDLAKEKWYLDKYHELDINLDNKEGFHKDYYQKVSDILHNLSNLK